MPPGANQVESDHNGQAGMRTYAGFVLRGTGARWRGADGGHDGMSGTGLGGSRELTLKATICPQAADRPCHCGRRSILLPEERGERSVEERDRHTSPISLCFDRAARKPPSER